MRVLLRVLAPVLGLVIAAAGAVLAVEVAAAWVLGAEPGYRGLVVPWPVWRVALDTVTWRSVLMLRVCGALGLVGLLLMLVGVTAGRRDIRLQDPAVEVSVTTSPRLLARLVGQRVREAERVAAASVTASKRAVRVVATCRGEVPEGLRAGVAQRADALLDDLPLARRPRLSVAVRSDGGPQ